MKQRNQQLEGNRVSAALSLTSSGYVSVDGVVVFLCRGWQPLSRNSVDYVKFVPVHDRPTRNLLEVELIGFELPPLAERRSARDPGSPELVRRVPRARAGLSPGGRTIGIAYEVLARIGFPAERQ